jgi:CheY-like chemotaxis protein
VKPSLRKLIAAAPERIVGPCTLGVISSAAASGASAGRDSAASTVRMRPIRDSSIAGSEPARVLLVEPDERSRSVMENALVREGFQIASAVSADGAHLQLAPGRPLPSVVVCEATLQGPDGFALCKRIRDEPRTAMLPVIMLSRRQESHHAKLAGGVGADDYLAKPTFANDVVALVHLRAGANSFDTSLRSSTEVVPLAKLLRALLTGIRSGRVEIESGGQITFREGLIVDASLDQLQGAAALTRMLLLADGDYTVTFSSSPVEASFSLGLEELCTAVFQRIGSWEKEVASGLPLDAKLVVNFARLGAVLSQLPVGVKELVRLCDGRRTVRRCLLDSSLPESLGLASLARLHDLGVLVPAREPSEISNKGPVAASSVSPTANVISLRSFDATADAGQGVTAGECEAAGKSPIQLIHAISGERREATELVNPAKERSASAPVVLPSGQTPAVGASKDAKSTHLSAGEVERALALHEIDTDVRTVGAPRPAERVHGRRVVRFAAAAVAVMLVAAGAAWVTGKAATKRATLAAKLDEAALASRSPRSATQPVESEESTSAPMAYEGQRGPEAKTGASFQSAQAPSAIPSSHPGTMSWLMVGRARFDSGDHRGAEEAAAMALQMNPNDGGAMMLRVSVFLATHQREKAAEELKRYLQTHPDGPYAEEARQLLSSW